MKFRWCNAPLLLCVVSFASALSDAARDNIESTVTKAEPRDPARLEPAIDVTKGRYDIGTKDAPVDGKDGKPHAGPFVGSEKDQKPKPKTVPVDGELVTKPGKLDTAELVTSDGTKIPQVNDGVMDDPNRQLPKQGTTGTEGGVSEKDKARKAHEGQTGSKQEKTPDPPKEAPPHSLNDDGKKSGDKSDTESAKSKSKDEDDDDDTAESLAGLEKPDDLPEKLSKDPHPVPGSAKKDHLDISNPSSKTASEVDLDDEDDNESLIQPLHSYVLSLTMILFSEIGDKTFLIAALMAMKHDRLLVFSAALCALIAMTFLSAVLGHAVPTLLPKRFTSFLAAGLFLIFGARMLREGLAMKPGEGVGAEMQEVEMELEEKEALARAQGRRRSSITPYALEMGLGRSSGRKARPASRIASPPRSASSSPDRSRTPPTSTLQSALGGLNNLSSLLLSPAWVQTFVMTFLGEWGDRSQIATIAMAAGQDYWWVTGGAISGHAVCTGVAVIGGRALAGRVSLRVVTLGGAGAFLIFGVIYLAEALYYA